MRLEGKFIFGGATKWRSAIELIRYPALSTLTEEETSLPEFLIQISLVDSDFRLVLDDRALDALSEKVQAKVRRASAQFKRDFVTWASLSDVAKTHLFPLKVILASQSHALSDETGKFAVAAADSDTAYFNYCLFRATIPVGFRLGVFDYAFRCRERIGHKQNFDESLHELALPLLFDQVKVLSQPERYAIFPKKAWLDALRAHVEKRHLQLDEEAVPGAPPVKPQASLRAQDAELSEAQQQRIAQLAARRKADQSLILQKMRTLVRIISTGLGEDVDIKVLPGEGWAYDYESNTITFPLLDLITVPPEKIVGFLLHEIGHYQVTRVDEKNPTFAHLLSSESLRLLLNAFEDPRANNWMKAAFPGTAPYLELTYDDLLSEDLRVTSYISKLQRELQKRSNSSVQAYEMLPHLEYLLSVLYFWRFGKLPPRLVNSRVKAALESTAEFFEPIFDQYPPGRVSEQEKRRYARKAAECIENYILGPYEKLLQLATDNLSLAIERGQQPLGEGENPSEINLQPPEQEARQILEEQSKELADRLSGKHTATGPVDAETLERKAARNRDNTGYVRISPGKPRSELTRRDLVAQRRNFESQSSGDVSEYQRAYAAVSELLQSLVGTLENVLAKNRKPKYEGYYQSGQKPDLRRVMDITRKIQQGVPTTKKDFDVFLKRRRPTHLDHRIMLLLDESGSMQEPKRTAALHAALLFMEAFDYLGIDYAIIGFADAPIIHKPFGANLSQREREHLFDDISQFIPLGSTADADALALGIDLFDQEPEDVYRLIVVISDGEGNVNTTGMSFKELQDAAGAKSIGVIGIGIGEQADSVSTRYDRPLQVATVQELPTTLGAVLREEVVGDASR
ncbi:MAG TPA: VWA domain-containing protein [Candidatus Acidoferrales bacterium]|nr:VWA domain-containing protein [Candidatus Acidoferrales bacterium]